MTRSESDNPPVVTARVSGIRRFRARLVSSWWLYKPVAILFVLVLLFVGNYFAYTSWTVPDTFPRELAVSLIGALITIGGTLIVAVVALREQLKKRFEAKQLLRFDADTWRQSFLKVGAMKIPDVVVVASCRHGAEWTEHAEMIWAPLTSQPRSVDELGEQAISKFIPRLKENAQKNSVVFTDDETVDMLRARVSLKNTEGGRKAVFNFVPAPSTYFRFVANAVQLDAPLPTGENEVRTLRELWRPKVSTIEDVARLKCPATVGTTTVVVTRDKRMVLGVRGRTLIAGQDLENENAKDRVHFVAEGVLPIDVDESGHINPLATARRGIHEELIVGNLTEDIGRVIDLKATGFFFDQLRMQPIFTYFAEIDLDWDELASAVPAAQDYWEVLRLQSLRFDINQVGIRRLMLGQHPDMELASNHAAAALWFACLYKFGFHRMRDALSIPVPALDKEGAPRSSSKKTFPTRDSTE